MDNTLNQSVLDHIAKLYREHNVEGIKSCFAPDGYFVNAKGKELSGDIYRGHEAIGKFFEGLFKAVPDVQWKRVAADRIFGNFAVTQWHRTATTLDGVKQSWLGCDLYEFSGTLIVKKDTYIKVVLE